MPSMNSRIRRSSSISTETWERRQPPKIVCEKSFASQGKQLWGAGVSPTVLHQNAEENVRAKANTPARVLTHALTNEGNNARERRTQPTVMRAQHTRKIIRST